MGGDEDERNLALAADELVLQLGPVHARYGGVEDQTTGAPKSAGLQERFGGREGLALQAERPQQIRQRLANGFIIVDHRYELTRRHHAFLDSGTAPAPATSGSSPSSAPAGSEVVTGMEKERVRPRPSLASAQMRPPWASMMERLIERPTPMPSGLVV